MLSAAFLMLILVVVFQSDVISSVVTPQQQQQQRYRSSLAQFRVECMMTCYNILFLSLIQIEQNKPFMVTMANANFFMNKSCDYKHCLFIGFYVGVINYRKLTYQESIS